MKLAETLRYKNYDVEMELFEIAKPSYYKVCMSEDLKDNEVLFVTIMLNNREKIEVNRSLRGRCNTLLLDTNSRAYMNDKINYERNKKVKTQDIHSVEWKVKVLKKNLTLDEGIYFMPK